MCRIIVFVIILVLSTALTKAAESAQACWFRDTIVKHLDKNHNEKPDAAGLAANGIVLELFTSEDGETWTMVMTTVLGVSCPMASGSSWSKAITEKEFEPI